ncbi:MAG: hypothetical protein ACI9XJ_002245 [Marivirga sp.]|jgi:hypothetical protein
MKPKSLFLKRMSILVCSVCYLFTAPLFIIPFVSDQFGKVEILILLGAGVSYLLGILFFHFANDFKNVKVSIILGITFPLIILGTFLSAYLVLDYYFSWPEEALLSAIIPLILICAGLFHLLARWLVRKYP